MTFQVSDVSKLLLSCKKATDRGNTVILEKSRPRMVTEKGEESELGTGNGVYIWKLEAYRGSPEQWLKEQKERKEEGTAGRKKKSEERPSILKKPKAAESNDDMEIDAATGSSQTRTGGSRWVR